MRTKTKHIARISLIVSLMLQVLPPVRAQTTQPRMADEQPISAAIDVGAESNQTRPEVAWGPKGGFAVWQDERLDTARIYGAALQNGASSKFVGNDLSGEVLAPRFPSVAPNGNGYLATWIEDTERGTELRGVLVKADGSITRANAFRVPAAIDSTTATASGNEGTIVAFTDREDDLSVLRVSRSGAIVGRPIEVYDEGPTTSPELTWGGGTFLLSFIACDEDCKFGARSARITWADGVLDRDGSPLTRTAVDRNRISSAWDGETFTVVWTEAGTIYGSKVDPADRPGNQERFVVHTSAASSPDIARTSMGYVVAWVGAGREISTTFLPDEPEMGNPAETPVSERASYGSRPVIASNGDEHLLAWEGHNGHYIDIFRVPLTAIGLPEDRPEVFVQSGFGQVHPSIAAGTGAYLALWQDYRSHSGPIVYGGRIAPNGELLDDTGFRISPDNGRHPVAAWNGEDWLVVWRQSVNGLWGLAAARVGADGTVKEPASIPLSFDRGRKRHFTVASDGDGFVVMWANDPGEPLHTTYVSRNGVPASSSVRIDHRADDPSLTWSDGRYVAVWGRDGNIKAAFLDARGDLLDAPRKIADTNGYEYEPNVAAGGGRAVVTWAKCRLVKQRGPCTRFDVLALGIGSSLDDGVADVVSSQTLFQDEPIAVWDGVGFAVIWKTCNLELLCDRPAGAIRYVDRDGRPTSAITKVRRAHVPGAPSFTAASLGDASITIVYRRTEGPGSVAGVPRGYMTQVRRG